MFPPPRRFHRGGKSSPDQPGEFRSRGAVSIHARSGDVRAAPFSAGGKGAERVGGRGSAGRAYRAGFSGVSNRAGAAPGHDGYRPHPRGRRRCQAVAPPQFEQGAVREAVRRGGVSETAEDAGFHRSEYRAFNMAVNRAAFCFRRFRALGFSKRRCSRTCSKVCSRSSFFLSRRRAFSTGSPLLSLISDISR